MLSTLGRVKPFLGHARMPAARKRRDWMRLRPSLETLEQKLVLSDISGQWQGMLTQPSGHVRTSFTFGMNLTQTQQSVSGTSRIEITGDPQHYGVMSLSGTVKDNVFNFQESTIIQQNPLPFTYWFIKS